MFYVGLGCVLVSRVSDVLVVDGFWWVIYFSETAREVFVVVFYVVYVFCERSV